MTVFRWLHLTDFHQGMSGQKWNLPGVKELFFDDLRHLCQTCGLLDLVIFTGDLTQAGTKEQFTQFDEFLDQLWDLFADISNSSQLPKLLAVPGNHDLVRPQNKDDDPDYKNAIANLRNYWSSPQDIRDNFWMYPQSQPRRVVEDAFDNYTNWWNNQSHRIPEGIQSGTLPGDFSYTFEKDGAKLGILGLNTSFLQLDNDNYQGKLAIETQQFQEACGNNGPSWVRDHHACLLLSHHPPSWLHEQSKKILNSEFRPRNRFAVHLCGHLHEAAYQNIASAGTEGKHTWQGRSLFGRETYYRRTRNGEAQEEQRLHGYTVGQIKLKENRKGEITFYPRSDAMQGGEIQIVPDYTFLLKDTIPSLKNTIEITLFQDCRNPEPENVSDDLELKIESARSLINDIIEQQKIVNSFKKMHYDLQKNCYKLLLFQQGIRGLFEDEYEDILKQMKIDWTLRIRKEVKKDIDFIETNECHPQAKIAIDENTNNPVEQIKNKLRDIDKLVNIWETPDDVGRVIDDLHERLYSFDRAINKYLTIVDRELNESIDKYHKRLQKLFDIVN